ncbi:MAG: serine/threonine protein kinase [Muribaculaceae bacterium]|nr:serine/threonine protein kinase [Muribaculaceae bacterium]
MQQLTKGATLQGGKYIIERVLGQGGFGITYLATHSFLEKQVAIKEFFPSGFCVRDVLTGKIIMTNPLMEKHKSKFVSEAKKLSMLNHKGIVKVIEVFEENGTAYYIMDYIAGQSLWEILQQRQFSVKESLQVIGKVSKALTHIHSKRMLHLDIKPMNIMIRSVDNEPIIIDFGISKTFDAKGNPNTTYLPAASPGYSPAEQFAGEINKFAPQIDIYSLGATLYTLLSGRVPTYPTPLTTSKLKFDDVVPFYVIKAVKTAMAYKQEDRYASVRDFLVALDLASPSPSKKTSVTESKITVDKPIIKSFGLKKDAPYYVNEEIELYWWVQNCERVYLNGQLQSGLRKTKTIKYDSPGKKRFIIKAVKGEEEVSMTRTFEVIDKNVSENGRSHIMQNDQIIGENFVIITEKTSAKMSQKKANPVTEDIVNCIDSTKKKENCQKYTEEKIRKQEETKVIIADVVEKKPEIIFFRRVGNEQIFIGDKVSVYWDVKGADELVIDDWYTPIKSNKAEIKVRYIGANTITLTARNSSGAVSKNLKVVVARRPEPPIIKKFGFNNKNKVFVGDTLTLEWNVECCRELKLNRDEDIPAIGFKTITFEHDGAFTYTLLANNLYGRESKTVSIIVYPKEKINNSKAGLVFTILFHCIIGVFWLWVTLNIMPSNWIFWTIGLAPLIIMLIVDILIHNK